MEFDLLRLSLIPRREPGLFMEERHRTATREEWLREILGKEVIFTHRRETFHYVPDDTADEKASAPLALLIGRIGRMVIIDSHQSPAGRLKEMLRDDWRASLVFTDPRHHEDGQKVAMEHDRSVGAPHAVFQSLVGQLNLQSGPYEIEVAPITDPSTFWDFVEKNEGQVTSVAFEFIAPNMFGIRDDWDKEMKELQKKENVQKMKLTIENKRGLNLKTKRIKSAVNYASRGTGTIKAKTKGGKKFNSRNKTKKAKIEVDKAEKGRPINWLKKMFSGIF